MNDTLTLDQLQIKRRELENELTELVQKEQELKVNLKTREKEVIDELDYIITDKKAMIQTLESQNNSLGKKLKKLKKAKKVQSHVQSTTENNVEELEDEIELIVTKEKPDHLEQQKTEIRRKKETKFFF